VVQLVFVLQRSVLRSRRLGNAKETDHDKSAFTVFAGGVSGCVLGDRCDPGSSQVLRAGRDGTRSLRAIDLAAQTQAGWLNLAGRTGEPRGPDPARGAWGVDSTRGSGFPRSNVDGAVL
jgi:hypothetical protein